MEFIGDFKDISMDIIGDVVNITITTDKSILAEYPKLKLFKKLSVKITEFRNNRSLDANKYSWVLIGKIAGALGTDNNTIYVDMLSKYGQTALDSSGNAAIITLKANIDITTVKGVYCALINHGYINGVECSNYRLLAGQSTYDTKEMAIFIDGIISECQLLEIETASPQKLKEMKERWGV